MGFEAWVGFAVFRVMLAITLNMGCLSPFDLDPCPGVGSRAVLDKVVKPPRGTPAFPVTVLGSDVYSNLLPVRLLGDSS